MSKVTVLTRKHKEQFIFTPTIVLDIDESCNTLFMGWFIWSIEIEFIKKVKQS